MKGDMARKDNELILMHTPTPWTARDAEIYDFNGDPLRIDNAWIEDSFNNGDGFAEEGKANAEFIVRAVNSHEMLLEAAKLALVAIRYNSPREPEYLIRAITQAEGE